MEGFPLAESILKPLLWLVPIALVLGFLRSPLVKGWFGEKLVSKKASLRLPQDEYFAYDNVTVQDAKGTTQIDHIFVSRFGLFIVETKNMGGWIFGNANQPQWTQVIYKQKNKFQNPIRQNYRHLKAIESLTQTPISKLHSVVVFTGDSTFKTDVPPSVCTLSSFVDYIRSFKLPMLTDNEIYEIRRKIENGRLTPSYATHSAHVRQLRDKKSR